MENKTLASTIMCCDGEILYRDEPFFSWIIENYISSKHRESVSSIKDTRQKDEIHLMYFMKVARLHTDKYAVAAE